MNFSAAQHSPVMLPHFASTFGQQPLATALGSADFGATLAPLYRASTYHPNANSLSGPWHSYEQPMAEIRTYPSYPGYPVSPVPHQLNSGIIQTSGPTPPLDPRIHSSLSDTVSDGVDPRHNFHFEMPSEGPVRKTRSNPISPDDSSGSLDFGQHGHSRNRSDLRCKVCHQSMASRQQLKQHIMENHVHSEDDKPYACPSCQLSFKRIAHLHRHQTVHTGSRNFVCPKCNKNFARNDHLTAHLWTHETGPFICAVCKYVGHSRADLKLHTTSDHPLRRRRQKSDDITSDHGSGVTSADGDGQ